MLIKKPSFNLENSLDVDDKDFNNDNTVWPSKYPRSETVSHHRVNYEFVGKYYTHPKNQMCTLSP